MGKLLLCACTVTLLRHSFCKGIRHTHIHMHARDRTRRVLQPCFRCIFAVCSIQQSSCSHLLKTLKCNPASTGQGGQTICHDTTAASKKLRTSGPKGFRSGPRYDHWQLQMHNPLGNDLITCRLLQGCMGMSTAYKDIATPVTDDESIAVIDKALQLGVTFLDTSDVYGPFTNEELVGAVVLLISVIELLLRCE